ncbi:hypothetical protein Rmet_6518 [Cupriavidus metallidurans CH34]|uniref:Uncharacterized protein n=1 Tax=Cupriavidus metallidurans (strain ATCC 43123 / DSM 2839 / NBRC 102507 / CH34) TaxID=266264 RepID=D3DXV6_CUPMC|nr:hypothetical protein Rmet_6518 [Cupriavidus metallidurans CH34]
MSSEKEAPDWGFFHFWRSLAGVLCGAFGVAGCLACVTMRQVVRRVKVFHILPLSWNASARPGGDILAPHP